ncbi:MAG: hypothetical protein ACR2NR_07400 [Solirubrobacteraceae bacterium]
MARPNASGPDRPDSECNVLIAGAGVAGLEAAFALRELAGDRVKLRLLAPNDEFVYRPLAVGEPFNVSWAQRYPLSGLAEQAGAELVHDALRDVDPQRHLALTESGLELSYDALLLGLGTSLHQPHEHVTSVDDSRMDELLHGLVQDVEEGYLHRLAFIIPAPIPWPLPAYELALMTSQRAWDMQVDLAITILTPESAPLAAFGRAASERVANLLGRREIELITSADCDVPDAKTIRVHPGGRTLAVDRIVALPELRGPGLPGLPHDASGFLAVDSHCKLKQVEAVWAAGDCTDSPVKHGGIAAQQADAAARSIASFAGAIVEPQPFQPVVGGLLETGDEPMQLGVDTGDDGAHSGLAGVIGAMRAPKLVARYLAPELKETAARRV